MLKAFLRLPVAMCYAFHCKLLYAQTRVFNYLWPLTINTVLFSVRIVVNVSRAHPIFECFILAHCTDNVKTW